MGARERLPVDGDVRERGEGRSPRGPEVGARARLPGYGTCVRGGVATEVLTWARENGCPWDWRTCAYAARGGHLEVLKWAREHGCPLDSVTCANAARVATSRS